MGTDAFTARHLNRSLDLRLTKSLIVLSKFYQEMKFRSDTELGFFLYRSLSDQFPFSRLVPLRNEATVISIEAVSEERCDWRVLESQLTELMESMDNAKVSNLLSEKNLTYEVGAERERTGIDELFGIQVTFSAQPDVKPEMIQYVRLLTTILSISVYGRDILSSTFLYSILCPDILPPIKRLAKRNKLNMSQSLESYVHDINSNGFNGAEPILEKNFPFLKSFRNTIEEMQSHFDEYLNDPRTALKCAVDSAMKFLLTQNDFSGSNYVRSAATFIMTEVDQVLRNFHEMENIIPHGFQKRAAFNTASERLNQDVLDRLHLLIPIEEILSFSSQFKTPVVAPSTPKGQFPPKSVGPSKFASPSPNSTMPSSFLNNGTPTPVRESTVVLEFLDAEKENIDPSVNTAQQTGENKEDITPVRPKKNLALKTRNRRSAGEPKPKKPSNRTLHDFFK